MSNKNSAASYIYESVKITLEDGKNKGKQLLKIAD